jgi:dynein heavy chain
MRALRPDRMLYALSLFAEEKLGRKYVENRTIECKIFENFKEKK